MGMDKCNLKFFSCLSISIENCTLLCDTESGRILDIFIPEHNVYFVKLLPNAIQIKHQRFLGGNGMMKP